MESGRTNIWRSRWRGPGLSPPMWHNTLAHSIKYKYKQTDKYREADTKYAKRKSAITSYRGGTRYDGPTPPKMETQSHANTKTKK